MLSTGLELLVAALELGCGPLAEHLLRGFSSLGYSPQEVGLDTGEV
jgi:hypothetical protein